jgi:hypothetical protein
LIFSSTTKEQTAGKSLEAGMPKRQRSDEADAGDAVTAANVRTAATAGGDAAALIAGQLEGAAECSSGVLMLTGAGIEVDASGRSPWDIEPNICHALGALVASTGGVLVTTNITDATLLAMPAEQPTAAFVAPHGTMCDQKNGKVERRRPRSFSQLGLPLLKGRRVYTEIPRTVEHDDPNVLDTRRAAAAPHLRTLLIMGNSLIKSSNGRALNFLSAMTAVERVVFVNPDTSRVSSEIEETLSGWKLPGTPHVVCVHSTGAAFAEQVLAQRGLRQRCAGWVAPAEVARKRRMLQLPPKNLGGQEDHKLGGRVHVGKLFDEMVRLHALARSQPPNE